MAIPASGDGQEVLRRGGINNQSNDPTSFDFTGGLPTLGDETDTVPANHIVTILSIIWCDVSGGAEEIRMYAKQGGGDLWILLDADIATNETYIFNEKLVLIGGDYLITVMQASTTVDVWYSYLDQDWS